MRGRGGAGPAPRPGSRDGPLAADGAGKRYRRSGGGRREAGEGGPGSRDGRSLEDLADRARDISENGLSPSEATQRQEHGPRTPKARPAGFCRALRGATAALLAIFALASAAVSAEYAISYGESYPRLTMRGAQVGGLDPSELLAEISDVAGGGQLAEYTFRAREPFAGASSAASSAQARGALPREFTRRASELGIDFSSRQSAERALAVGREGAAGQQLADRIGSRFGEHPISAAIGYDPELAREEIAEMAQKVEVSPSDASVSISADGVELQEHTDGVSVDEEATLAALESALGALERDIPLVTELTQPEILTAGARPAAAMAREILADPPEVEAEGTTETLELDADRTARALSAVPRPDEGAVALAFDAARLQDAVSEYVSDVERPPEDAAVVPDGVGGARVEPATAGLDADPAALEETLAEGVPAGDTRFTLPTREIRPDVATGEADKLLPSGTLGEHTASYSPPDEVDGSSSTDMDARADNLETLAGALDGTLVAPSESVSLNSVLTDEEISLLEDGGLRAETSGEDSGGASQLASALYRAALASGMEIGERHPGSQPLPYAEPALEAVVSGAYSGAGEDRDLVVANPTEAYMVINASVTESGSGQAAVEVSVSGREEAFPADAGPAAEVDSERATEGGATESGADEAGTEWVSYTENEDGERTIISRETYAGGGSSGASEQDTEDSSGAAAGSANDSGGGGDE